MTSSYPPCHIYLNLWARAFMQVCVCMCMCECVCMWVYRQEHMHMFYKSMNNMCTLVICSNIMQRPRVCNYILALCRIGSDKGRLSHKTKLSKSISLVIQKDKLVSKHIQILISGSGRVGHARQMLTHATRWGLGKKGLKATESHEKIIRGMRKKACRPENATRSSRNERCVSAGVRMPDHRTDVYSARFYLSLSVQISSS